MMASLIPTPIPRTKVEVLKIRKLVITSSGKIKIINKLNLAEVLQHLATIQKLHKIWCLQMLLNSMEELKEQ